MKTGKMSKDIRKVDWLSECLHQKYYLSYSLAPAPVYSECRILRRILLTFSVSTRMQSISSHYLSLMTVLIFLRTRNLYYFLISLILDTFPSQLFLFHKVKIRKTHFLGQCMLCSPKISKKSFTNISAWCIWRSHIGQHCHGRWNSW
jgi:hypothetical protein